jgi:hypothetical protein
VKTLGLFLGLMLLLVFLPQSYAQQMGLQQGDWVKYEFILESDVTPIDDLLIENVKIALSIPPTDCSIHEIDWIKVQVLDFEDDNPILEKSLACNGEEIMIGIGGSNHGYYAPIDVQEGYALKDGTLDPPTVSGFEQRMYGDKKVSVTKFYTETISPIVSGKYENYKTYYFENSSGFLLENSFQLISENHEVMDDIDLTVGYRAIEFNLPRENPLLSIDAQTSKSFYDYGESVSVTGKIRNYDHNVYSDIPLEFLVLDPTGNLTKMGQVNPSEHGTFSFNFAAKGMDFESSGAYTVQLGFGLVEAEIPMFLVEGAPEVEGGDRPPRILQLQDIDVFAEISDGLVMVTFDISATDDVDEKITPQCKPESGFLFGIGETLVKCTARDSAGNFANPMSFTIRVNPPHISIPDWVKNVAGFWCEDMIDDTSFVEGIQYLIDSGIIVVPSTSESLGATQEIPQWVKNNACWWSMGAISDLEFAYGIEYLVREGIIRV